VDTFFFQDYILLNYINVFSLCLQDLESNVRWQSIIWSVHMIKTSKFTTIYYPKLQNTEQTITRLHLFTISESKSQQQYSKKRIKIIYFVGEIRSFVYITKCMTTMIDELIEY